jgi:hypothetical protein
MEMANWKLNRQRTANGNGELEIEPSANWKLNRQRIANGNGELELNW